MPPRKPKPGQSLADLEPELCKEWSPRNELPPTEYMRYSNKKVLWMCSRGQHEFSAAISYRAGMGTGCPYCAGKKPILHETDLLTLEPELCREWNYYKNEKGPENYTRSSGKKVLWRCSKGHEWYAVIYKRAVQGHNCPSCAGRQVLQGFNDLLTLEPELCREWNYYKNEKGPENYTKGSDKKVWWCCSKGHGWETKIYQRTGAKSGCPTCSGKKVLIGFNDLLTLYPNVFNIWSNKNKYPPEHYTKGSNKSVLFICKEHNTEYKQVISNYTSGQNGCPKCQRSSTSRIEQHMAESLGASNRYKLPNTLETSRYKTWEVDVFLVDQNFVVEFDGSRWHDTKFSKNIYEKDMDKTLDLLKQGFKVLRIREKRNGYEAKPLKIKHTNYHELYWEHNESTYPSELPDELLDKIREICYS